MTGNKKTTRPRHPQYALRYSSTELVSIMDAVADLMVRAYGRQAPSCATRVALASAFVAVHEKPGFRKLPYQPVVDGVLSTRAMWWVSKWRHQLQDAILAALETNPQAEADDDLPFPIYFPTALARQNVERLLTKTLPETAPPATPVTEPETLVAKPVTGSRKSTSTTDPAPPTPIATAPSATAPIVSISSDSALRELTRTADASVRTATALERIADLLEQMLSRPPAETHDAAQSVARELTYTPVPNVTTLPVPPKAARVETAPPPPVDRTSVEVVPSSQHRLGVVFAGQWRHLQYLLQEAFPLVVFHSVGEVSRTTLATRPYTTVGVTLSTANRQEAAQLSNVMGRQGRVLEASTYEDVRALISRILLGPDALRAG